MNLGLYLKWCLMSYQCFLRKTCTTLSEEFRNVLDMYNIQHNSFHDTCIC